MDTIVLTLFITGQTTRSQAAVANLRKICQQLSEPYELNIVDVLEQPELAEEARILATPTLLKSNPPPARQVVGDLSDREQVLLWLSLVPEATSGSRRPPPTPLDAAHNPPSETTAKGTV